MSAKFYRTTHGDHRHASYSCANAKRAIASGDPIALSDDEAASWTPCSDCCTPSDIKAHAEQASKADVYCTGQMVPANPRKLYRKCECGYEGKVGANGLRAHKPQS
jgi:hypothetical protein